jgi:peptide/nickel transport system permease protein
MDIVIFVSFKKYLVKRVVASIALLLVAMTMNFALIHMAPGDPVTFLIGSNAPASEEYIRSLREYYGLDKPIPVQYFLYLSSIFQGNFGYSFAQNRPVLDVVLERVPATVLLMGTSLIFACIFAVILGVFAARRPHSLVDSVISMVSLTGVSLDVSWFGLVLLLVFSVWLGLVPTSGISSLRGGQTGLSLVFDILHHLILPAVAVGAWFLATMTHLVRSKMMQELNENYIVTARAQGLRENDVVYKHALPNSLLPLLTMIGMNASLLLSGAIIAETVFGWPGMGRLFYDGVMARDYPVVMGCLIAASAMVVLSNFITDLVYTIVDPRVEIK